MAGMWNWLVRYPAAVFAALSLGLGWSGVAEWELAMPATLLFYAVALSAGGLARRARERAEMLPPPLELPLTGTVLHRDRAA